MKKIPFYLMLLIMSLTTFSCHSENATLIVTDFASGARQFQVKFSGDLNWKYLSNEKEAEALALMRSWKDNRPITVVLKDSLIESVDIGQGLLLPKIADGKPKAIHPDSKILPEMGKVVFFSTNDTVVNIAFGIHQCLFHINKNDENFDVNMLALFRAVRQDVPVWIDGEICGRIEIVSWTEK
jgi:hypothetical protein